MGRENGVERDGLPPGTGRLSGFQPVEERTGPLQALEPQGIDICPRRWAHGETLDHPVPITGIGLAEAMALPRMAGQTHETFLRTPVHPAGSYQRPAAGSDSSRTRRRCAWAAPPPRTWRAPFSRNITLFSCQKMPFRNVRTVPERPS